MTRRWTAAAIAAGLMLLTGCATDTGPDDDNPDSAAVEAVGPLGQEPGKIDAGGYRTTPLPEFGVAGRPDWGQSVEGQRMAEFVTLPHEVDPTLVDGGGGKVLRGGGAVSLIISPAAADAATRLGMVAGFSSNRSTAETSGTKELLIAVFRFPDAAAATAAADEMSGIVVADGNEFGGAPERPHRIEDLPDTRASIRPFGGTIAVNAFTPHGPYVIYTWAKTSETQQDWIEKATTKALDLQGPLIDRFPATPVDRLDSLPMDIDGVLRLTVPKLSGDQRYTDDQAVFGPRGAAHFSTDPESSMDLFTDTGMTNQGRDLDTLYLTADADSARKLAAAFAKEVELEYDMTKIPGPPGVPNAACWRADSTRDTTTSYCLVQHDRYLGEITTPDTVTAYQVMSAQYLILDAAN